MTEQPISEPEIQDIMARQSVKEMEKRNDYPETIFKSSYYLGEHQLNLFMNYRQVSKSYSFIIRKGKWNTIYNLTEAEKVPFLKALLRQLPHQDRIQLMMDLEKEQ